MISVWISALFASSFLVGVCSAERHQLSVVDIDNGTVSLLAGSGNQGRSEGRAVAADLNSPISLAVEGKTVFVLCADDSLRICTPTAQQAHWMRQAHQAATAFGILDPNLRRKSAARKAVRDVALVDALAKLREVVEDRQLWYDERGEELDREGDRSLKGPEGVLAVTSHNNWLVNVQQLDKLVDYLRAAGLEDLLPGLQLSRFNTMRVENLFALGAISGNGDAQTLRGFVAMMERLRVEFIKQHTDTGFAYVTSTRPFYVESRSFVGIPAQHVLQLLTSQQQAKQDSNAESSSAEESWDMRKLAMLLAKQKSRKLRDVYKRPVGFPLHLTGVERHKPEAQGSDYDDSDEAGAAMEDSKAPAEPLGPRPQRHAEPSQDLKLSVASQADSEDDILDQVLELSRLEQLAQKRRPKRHDSGEDDYSPEQESGDALEEDW